MTKTQLKAKLNDPRVVVLNVLPESEYLKMHIAGSRNHPLGQDHGAFIQDIEKQYGKNRPFITYCSDVTSALCLNAAQILRDHGLNADHYPGGIEEWKNAGWPISGTQVVARVVQAPSDPRLSDEAKKAIGWWDRQGNQATGTNGGNHES